MTDYRPIVTDEEWGNHQRALFRVTVDNYETALSEDPLGLEGMRSRLAPLPDVPEDVARRQDAERAQGGSLTDFASTLGASLEPLPDGRGERLGEGDLLPQQKQGPPSFAEFMAQYEQPEPRGIDLMAPDAPPEEGPANLNPALSLLDRAGKAVGGAIKSVVAPIGRLPGEIADFARMATTPYVDASGQRRPWSEAPAEEQYGRVNEAASATTAVAGDVAQVYPPWALANAEFNAARGALTGSGLVPEDSLLADAGALVTQVGGPAALRAAQRTIAPELDAAAKALPRFTLDAAKAVDDFGRQFPALERGQVNPGALVESVDEALERVGQMLNAGKPPRVPSTGIEEAAGGATTRIASIWDQGAPLRKVQQRVYARLGRAPTVEEDAALQLRLYAGRAAAAGAKVEDELLPVLKGLSPTEKQALEEYMVLADNADKAAAVGQRVQREMLGEALPSAAGETALRRANQSLAGRQRQLPRLQQAVTDAEDAQRIVEQEYRAAQLAAKSRSAATLARLDVVRAERDRARSVVLAARQQAREVESALSSQASRVTSADIRAKRVGQTVDDNISAAESGRMEGAALRGAESADARLFSGNVHAHDLPQVQNALWNKYGGEVTGKVMNAADEVWRYTQSLRDRLHDAGVIADDVYEAWTRDFPHYAKADILKYMDDAESAARVPTGRPVLTVSDLKLGRLTEEGTKEARDRPLNSVIRQTFAVESLARRNEAAQALLKMRNADSELAALLKPAKDDHALASGERYFSVYVDGKQQRFVGPKELEGLYRIDPPEIPQWMRLASTVMGAPLLRAGATGVNLGFMLPNALRDAQEFMRRTGGFGSLGRFRTSASALGRAYVDSVASKGGPDWQEALRAGAGQFSEYTGLAPDQIVRRLTKEGRLGGRVRPVTSKADLAGVVADLFKLPFEPVRAIGETIERAPRLAAYRMARQAGQEVPRAALAARDITMDFARGGNAAKVLNTFVPFFNAGMQGVERFVTHDLAKGQRLKTGIGLVTSVVVPTMAAEAYNRSQYPEDWADVPDYLKDTGFVVLLPIEPQPNSDGTRGQRPYIWIPRPQSTNFISSLVTRTMEHAFGDDSRQWEDALGSIVGSVSPVGLESLPLPPVARTAFELQANKDLFRNREIVPERLHSPPPSEQALPETSAAGRAVGRVLNKPPVAVDYAITSTAGGVGKAALKSSDALARILGLPAAEPAKYAPVLDVPVAGDIAGSVLRNRGGQRVSDASGQVNREFERERDAQIAELKAHPDWPKLSRAEQQEEIRLISERLSRQAGTRRRAAREDIVYR